MSEALTVQRPQGWKGSPLFEFVEDCWGNSLSTVAHRGLVTQRLTEIDRVFAAIVDGNIKPSSAAELLPSLLFIRSLTTFRASVLVGTCLHTEGYILIRACLENAGYAAFLASDEKLSEIWLRRNESLEAEKRVRDTFTNNAVKRHLKTRDARVAQIYEQLYDRAIDWGAHPNEKSLTANFVKSSLDGNGPLQLKMLPGGGQTADLTLRTAAQAAICVLDIFFLVLPQAFKDEHRAQLNSLKQTF